MLVGAGDDDGVSHDQLAAIGREYSTLVKKRAENKDGQRSTGLGSDPHAEAAEHRPGGSRYRDHSFGGQISRDRYDSGSANPW